MRNINTFQILLATGLLCANCATVNSDEKPQEKFSMKAVKQTVHEAKKCTLQCSYRDSQNKCVTAKKEYADNKSVQAILAMISDDVQLILDKDRGQFASKEICWVDFSENKYTLIVLLQDIQLIDQNTKNVYVGKMKDTKLYEQLREQAKK
jgi:hypothetical protein